MELVGGYPVIVTEELRACRDFYRQWFGFEVAFEASWFVLLQTASGPWPVALAFMHPDHPSSPPTPAAYKGDGAFVTLQVADARVEYDRLRGVDLDVALPLTEEPWGQRRFGVLDPAGMWVDVVEQIDPVAGWWNPYLEIAGE